MGAARDVVLHDSDAVRPARPGLCQLGLPGEPLAAGLRHPAWRRGRHLARAWADEQRLRRLGQPLLGSYNTSALVYGDYYYTLLDRGILLCHDARTGKQVYGRQRVSVDASGFTASPWAYNGKIFAISEDGDTFVLQAGPSFKLLGKNTRRRHGAGHARHRPRKPLHPDEHEGVSHRDKGCDREGSAMRAAPSVAVCAAWMVARAATPPRRRRRLAVSARSPARSNMVKADGGYAYLAAGGRR